MKNKHFFLASALLMASVGASAQTDVTSTYLTNADFSSTEGWTAVTSAQFNERGNGLIGTYGVRTAEGQAVSTVDATHLATEYCFGFEVRWESNYAAFTQTTSELPIGAYTLTYDVENTNPNTTKATYDNRFFVQIGDVKTTDKSTEWMAAGKSSWTTHSITFNVTSPTTATISLGYGTGSNNIGSKNTPTLHVSHLKLTWTDPLEAGKAALQAEIDKAKLCDAKEGLADAITAAESALTNATTADELANALATLQTADKDAILRYDNGLADATYAAPVATSFVVNGTFDSGISPWQRTGTYQNNKTANNQSGAFTGNFYENWNGSAQANKMYQTISNIPNGTYRLDIAAFVNTLADPNESQYVFANNDKTYLTTGAPTAYEVYTVVTNNQIEIGLEQTTATANWMGIDNVSLRYYGAGDVINDAKNASHKLAWEEAKAAAEAAVANTDYQNVTGAELTTLNAEIAKAEPSTADGYDEAAAALTAATSTFTAAKASYDALVAAKTAETPELAYADAAKKTTLTEAKAATVSTAAEATTAAAAITTALRAYYESHAMAEGVEGAVDQTSAVAAANADTNTGWTNGIGTNQGQGYTDAAGTVASKYLDGGWAQSTGVNIDMTRSVEIPAGKYLLTATARGAIALDTYTLSIGGQAANLPKNGSTGGVFGNGWDDVSVEFVTDGTAQTLEVVAKSEAAQQWISINRFRLVRLELYTEMADAEDYTALNAAIEAAEAMTLGFEEGEYAPYNNVDVLKAIATAKAIDQNVENAKEDVTTLTTMLTDGWTANEEDVDAIYNGDFATVAAGANYPDGWKRTNAWGQMQSGLDGNFATAYYNQPGSLQYGNQGAYTMPLAANTAYQLVFWYRSHENNSNNGITVSVLNADNEGLAAVTFERNSSTTDWVSATAYFTTGAAGNYVLTLANNGNTWMTGVSLVKFEKAASIDLTETEGLYRDFNRTYAQTVTIERTIKEGFNTVCLPFDLTAEQVAAVFGENAKVYTFEDVPDGENSTINFNTKAENTIAANVPVLIGDATATTDVKTINNLMFKTAEAKVNGTNFDFVGTYAPMKVAENDYFIGEGAVYKSTGTTTMNAFRAYIQNKTNATGDVKLFIDGLTTGIDAISGEAAASAQDGIYNLAGQRVSKAQRGIYVVGGKKVLVK